MRHSLALVEGDAAMRSIERGSSKFSGGDLGEFEVGRTESQMSPQTLDAFGGTVPPHTSRLGGQRHLALGPPKYWYVLQQYSIHLLACIHRSHTVAACLLFPSLVSMRIGLPL